MQPDSSGVYLGVRVEETLTLFGLRDLARKKNEKRKTKLFLELDFFISFMIG